jgi:hypothetical protein
VLHLLWRTLLLQALGVLLQRLLVAQLQHLLRLSTVMLASLQARVVLMLLLQHPVLLVSEQ